MLPMLLPGKTMPGGTDGPPTEQPATMPGGTWEQMFFQMSCQNQAKVEEKKVRLKCGNK